MLYVGEFIMERRKVICVIFLAICMLLSMSLDVTVTAAEASTSGSITIHKYDGVKGNPNDGNKITDDSALGNPIGGISFKVAKVVLADNGTIVDRDGNEYGVDSSFQSSGFANGVKVVTTAKDGTVVLNNLSLGIYYVEEQPSGDYTVHAPFFVQIPMSHSVGSSPLYDVHVYPKNQAFEFDKEVVGEVTTPERGSIVTWQVSSTIPSNIAEADVFQITDVMEDKRLEYAGNLKITSGEKGSGDSLSAYFNQVYDPDTKTLTITATNFSALAQYEKVYVMFDTKIVVSQSDPDELANILNKAKLEYKNSNGTSFEKTVEKEYGSHGITLRKFDDSGERLDGAEFYLFTDEKAAQDAMNGVEGAIDKALKDPRNASEPWKVIAGEANFFGLSDGIYYLAETKAPSGYNKLKNPVEVVLDADGTDSYFIVKFGNDKAIQHDLAGQVAVIDVENHLGIMLPVTDGPGIWWFTLIGLLLMGIALLTYNMSKDKEKLS